LSLLQFYTHYIPGCMIVIEGRHLD